MRYFRSIFIISVLICFLNAKDVNFQDSKIPMIVPVSWLKSKIGSPNLVIIDVRDEKSFKKGHIAHAINMPVFKDFFDKDYMMPKLDRLKELYSDAGIDSHSMVVVYGDNQLIWAARAYWVSRVLGIKHIGILRVGYGGWKKGVMPIETVAFRPKRREFVPRIDNSILQTKLGTLLSIGKKVIIDGRPKEFYCGKKSHAKRFGHIPTALNYPGSSNYEISSSGSRMKDFKTLERLYKNLSKDKEIVLYCEDGADAALNFLILEKLGYKVSVYDGSWLEWGNDHNLPIENPSKR